jgi:hypothetical protein
MHLYEDLYGLGASQKLVQRVDAGVSVLNSANKRHGIKARRGDGSFGAILPHVPAIKDAGFAVARGPIATIEIGVEVKILMKAMLKQIDRVSNDLRGQAQQFRIKRANPVCVGIVGINEAPYCVTYEKDRAFRTDGREYVHPVSEAAEAAARLIANVSDAYDEFLVLPFVARNDAPFSFAWANEKKTTDDYGACLVRISSHYETRL